MCSVVDCCKQTAPHNCTGKQWSFLSHLLRRDRIQSHQEMQQMLASVGVTHPCGSSWRRDHVQHCIRRTSYAVGGRLDSVRLNDIPAVALIEAGRKPCHLWGVLAVLADGGVRVLAERQRGGKRWELALCSTVMAITVSGSGGSARRGGRSGAPGRPPRLWGPRPHNHNHQHAVMPPPPHNHNHQHAVMPSPPHNHNHQHAVMPPPPRNNNNHNNNCRLQ